MARLSVNLNKVALLRNSRRTGVPNVLEFAQLTLEAGAAGITLHPRPDERHIRRDDVAAIALAMKDVRPKVELNIEGYPDERFLEVVREVKPEQCTLVPDAPGAFTSEEGWRLDEAESRIIREVLPKLRSLGSRVILFVDPDPSIVAKVHEVGADGIEIYTGGYARAFRSGEHQVLLDRCVKTAQAAREAALLVNIGHDLNLQNIPPLIERIPFVAEASIGHELTADALKVGFTAAVHAYAAALIPTAESADSDDPFKQFRVWFTQAERRPTPEQNAAALATASKDALPSLRVVLLKDFDERGFVFFTNYESRKGRELAENPRASLLFYWPELRRQVRISGEVSKVSPKESEAYFRSRSRESQLGAWASPQSSVIGRAELEQRVREMRAKFEGKEIPLPPHWGGYRLVPVEFEFWQGGEHRLHTRARYQKSGNEWIRSHLAP